MEAEIRLEGGRSHAPVQELTLLAGVAFLVLGVAGFIPGITTHFHDLSFAGHGSRAKIFGTFQTSVLDNLLHLVFGLAGIALSRTRQTAHAYLVGGGAVYLVVFLYGFLTSDGSGANFVPLNRADDVLHLSVGLAMLVFGLLPDELPGRSTDTVGGFLASMACFIAAIGVAYRPLRLIPLAILLSLIAAGIGGRSGRLAMVAVIFCGVCFVLGMAAAVVTSHPLW